MNNRKKYEKPLITEVDIEFDEHIDELFSSTEVEVFAPDGGRGD